MRKNEIRKILKQEIEHRVPEQLDLSKFNLKPSEKPVKSNGFSMQRKFGLALASFMVIFVVIFSFLLQPNQPQNPTQPYTFSGENQVVSFSAMSTAAILSHAKTETLLTNFSVQRLNTISTNPVIDHVLPYLELAERFLNDNNGFVITETTSELPEYTYKTEFKTSDLTRSTITYVMYYNLLNEEIDGDESSYDIEGILIYGNKTYDIFGSKEIEEDEETYSFKSSIDEQNYVRSSYKQESEETKFSFEVVVDGVVVEESVIEIETEDDEKEISLEFVDGNNFGTYKFEYEEAEGNSLLAIEFESFIDGIERKGEIEVYVVFDEITQTSSYKLIVDEDDDEDEYEYEARREDDKDDDDDDEDEDDEDEENEEDEEDTNDEEDENEENEDDEEDTNSESEFNTLNV